MPNVKASGALLKGHTMTEASASPYIYVTTTGWKTGQAHQIEIWFVAYHGHYYILAEGRTSAHWVQNIQHQPAVSFRLGTQTYVGTGRIVDSSAEPDLAAAVSALMDAKYDWSDGLIVELTPTTEVTGD